MELEPFLFVFTAKQNSLEIQRSLDAQSGSRSHSHVTSNLVPLSGSDLYRQQQQHNTGRDVRMDYSVAPAIYPSSRTITIASPRPLVVNGISEALTPMSGSKYVSDNPGLGTHVRPQEGSSGGSDSYLKNHGGLVSFNFGSPARTDSTSKSASRSPTEHSDTAYDIPPQRQFGYQRPIDSQVLPLSTHHSVQNSTNVGNNYNVDLKQLIPGLTDDSMFRDSNRQNFSDYSAERLSDSDRSKGLLQVCPICNHECSDMTMENFQAHVFDCFDNEAEPPETLQPQLTTNDRKCPMCESVFPQDISQDDFENHVQSHFGSEGFEVLRP